MRGVRTPRLSACPCLLLTAAALAGTPAGSAHAAAPGAARAATPEPLVDAAPLRTSFRDRVISSAGQSPRARAAQSSGQTSAYSTKDGQTIAVTFSSGYRADPAVAQTYVDFLGSLPHGSELSRLRIYLAPPAEVQQACGGADGTLACYSSGTNIMTIPGEQTDAQTGVTTSYVVAHEYGHHIASFRSNAPWPAIAFGPKRWASYERVCALTARGLLAPGDEGQRYLDNPGEGWADTYAHLVYPDVGWQFSPRLKPDAGAFAAALRDVEQPWTKNVVRTFRSSFSSRQSVKSYRFTITLDGSLSIALAGPRATNYDLRLTSGRQVVGTTKARGSHDRLRIDTGCRDRAAEPLTVTVTRRSGRGPFSLKVSYPG